MKLLFVGNSHTYVNDLPAMFMQLCQAAGENVYTHSVTKGGWRLRQYADPENEFGIKLREEFPKQHWDLIVLQDNSLQPTQHPDEFFPAVRALCELMHNHCNGFALYQTHPFEKDSPKCIELGLVYEDMQRSLHDNYALAAQENNALRVPAGDCYYRCFKEHPHINLYAPDRYHPSPNGTYMACCAFYAFIFNKSPLNLSVPDIVDADAAPYLRQIAHDVWQDNK